MGLDQPGRSRLQATATAIMLGTAASWRPSPSGANPRSVVMVFQPPRRAGPTTTNGRGRRARRIDRPDRWPDRPSRIASIPGHQGRSRADARRERQVRDRGLRRDHRTAWRIGRDRSRPPPRSSRPFARDRVAERRRCSAVVNVAKISASSTFNVIPPNASLAGTPAVSPPSCGVLDGGSPGRRGVATAHRCPATATYLEYPSVNHRIPRQFERIAREELGDERTVRCPAR